MNTKRTKKFTFTSFLNLILAILMGIILFSVVLQVFTRYVLQSGTAWSEVLSRYAFVWATMVGATLAVRELGHFNMDIVTKKLKPRAGRILFIGSNIVVLTFLVMLTVASWKQVSISMALLSEGFKVRMGYIYLIMPICGIIMVCFVIEIILNAFKKKFWPYESSGRQ